MSQGRHFLHIPGPSPIPDRILRAIGMPIIDHRSAEFAALGREVLGGNGLLLEHDVARFFVDAEAVYSYEGTHDITALIVGRALTGASAFL